METNEKGTPAKTNDHRRVETSALVSLDPKLLSVNKRLDSKDVDGERERNKKEGGHKKQKHSRNASCSKKQGQLKLIFIECYPSSWSKGEME